MSKMANSQKYGLVIVLAAIIIAAVTLGGIALFPPPLNPIYPGEVDIQVINGDTTVYLNFSSLVSMTPDSGFSSAQNRFDNWRDHGNYRGVSLAYLIELVGGIDTNDVVRVNATDGYTQYYAYSNLYPNATIAAIQGDLVLAYLYNDSTPGSHEDAWADGARTVFLPSDGAYSNDDANQTTHPAWFFGSAGARWVRNVATIEVIKDVYIDSRLHVTVIDGEDERDIYLMDLAGMNNLEAYTAYQNQFDNWRGNGTYTGILLSDLIEIVADIDDNDIVNVSAIDGYTQSFAYHNLYPNSSIHAIQGDLILAYIYNGTITPGWVDGPQMAFLAPDGGFSNTDASQTIHPDWFTGSGGAFWIRNVLTIRVIRDGLAT
ncbi:MAG: hypothetical protein ACFFDE_02945 [Promethearchaeota archaeon]